MLLDTHRAPFEQGIEALLEGPRDLDYVEGKNLAIEWRFFQNRPEGIPDAAAELVQLPVDVIVAGGTAAAVGAHEASDRVPIVAAGFSNPDLQISGGKRLIQSLGRPGANVTGVTAYVSALAARRVELLVAMLGDASRIAVLWANSEYSSDDLKAIEQAAQKLGVDVVWEQVGDPADPTATRLTLLHPAA